MFALIGTEHPREPDSFRRLVFTVWSSKGISIHTVKRRSVDWSCLGTSQCNCSLLVQNITAAGVGWYSFLWLINEYCKRKEVEERFGTLFHSARNQCIDYFLNFLKETFKMFLSRNALKAITDFQQEEENVMQLLEWIDKDQMDEERIMACIDVFNMVGKLLAKMMSRRKFKSKYDLLKNKCEEEVDQQRLSECLTSLGIKEVFNCSCTPGSGCIKPTLISAHLSRSLTNPLWVHL